MSSDEEPAYLRRQRETEEQRYRRALDGKTWWINLASVCALILTVLVGAVAIEKSDSSTDRQIAANKASSDQQISALKDQTLYAERAWVDAQNIRIGGPLSYDVNGANFMLAFWLKNVGHAPATSVIATPFVTTPLLPEYGNNGWSGAQYGNTCISKRRSIASTLCALIGSRVRGRREGSGFKSFCISSATGRGGFSVLMLAARRIPKNSRATASNVLPRQTFSQIRFRLGSIPLATS